jgi:hypothetical protein
VRFDLKRPCKNCPFGKADTRITFAGRDRAAEIAESAYRNGFPCHLSAHNLEDDEGYGEGGFVFAADGSTQHCAGAIGMFLNDGYSEWPGIDNDCELAERLAEQLGDAGLALCFDTEEDFIEANRGTRDLD